MWGTVKSWLVIRLSFIYVKRKVDADENISLNTFFIERCKTSINKGRKAIATNNSISDHIVAIYIVSIKRMAITAALIGLEHI